MDGLLKSGKALRELAKYGRKQRRSFFKDCMAAMTPDDIRPIVTNSRAVRDRPTKERR